MKTIAVQYITKVNLKIEDNVDINELDDEYISQLIKEQRPTLHTGSDYKIAVYR